MGRPLPGRFQKLSNLLEIFPEDLLFSGIAKNVGRVDRRQSLRALKIVESAPNFRDAFFDAEKCPDGRSSQTAYEARVDGPDLAQHERRAHPDLVRQRRAIARRPAFHDVANVDFLALHSNELDHAIQKLAGTPYEGKPLRIFVGTRPFPNKNQFGVRIALAKDNRVAS